MLHIVAQGLIVHVVSVIFVVAAFLSYFLISWLKEFEPRKGKMRKEDETAEYRIFKDRRRGGTRGGDPPGGRLCTLAGVRVNGGFRGSAGFSDFFENNDI